MKHIAREKFLLNMIKKCLGSSGEIWRNYPGYLLKYNPNRFDSNVKVIQNKLQNIGYSVGKHGADGYFGDGTLLAVKCFQRDCNLMMDGIVGVNTWNRIMRE